MYNLHRLKGKQKYVGKGDFCGVFGGNPDIFKDFLPFVTADFFFRIKWRCISTGKITVLNF